MAGIMTRFFVLVLLVTANDLQAHTLHKQGEAVVVAESPLTVTPPREWNQLGSRIGKNTETWTLDGEQLDKVTFFGGIAPGHPLVNDTSAKGEELPKFGKTTALAEVPSLLGSTVRALEIGNLVEVSSVEPIRFLDNDGILFCYEFTDKNQLTRKGEARAAIIDGKLYMITFEAPRLNYFAKVLPDFRALADTAKLR